MEEQKRRYTDEELEEFRQIILDKLELAKRDYQVLMDELTNKNDLIATVLGTLNAPIAAFARVINAIAEQKGGAAAE